MCRPARGRAEASPAAGGCRPGVRVPRRVREDPGLRDVDVAVYTVLLGRCRDGSGRVTIGQRELMARLGRGRGARPDAVAEAAAALEAAGYLGAARRHTWSPYTYTLLVRPGPRGERFDVVPYEVLDALRTAVVTPGALRTWLHLDQFLGDRGWTARGPDTLADGRGVSVATARRHLDQLHRVGTVLEISTRARGGWLLSRPSPTAPPTEHDERGRTSQTTVDAETGGRSAVDNFAGSPLTISRGHRGGLAHEHLAHENNCSSSQRCCDRPGHDVREAATDGLRPKKAPGGDLPGGVFAQAGVAEAVRRLGPEWTTGGARRWLPGVSATIATHLEHEMTPAAAAAALTEFGQACLEQTGGRHVLAARAALRLKALDLRHGLACPHCGAALAGPGDPCERCHLHEGDADGPASADPDEAGLVAQRVAIYREWGTSADQLDATDPAAASALRAPTSAGRAPRKAPEAPREPLAAPCPPRRPCRGVGARPVPTAPHRPLLPRHGAICAAPRRHGRAPTAATGQARPGRRHSAASAQPDRRMPTPDAHRCRGPPRRRRGRGRRHST